MTRDQFLSNVRIAFDNVRGTKEIHNTYDAMYKYIEDKLPFPEQKDEEVPSEVKEVE